MYALTPHHIFELAVAVSWATVGVTYLTDGDALTRSPVGRNVGAWSVAWSILYIVAGVLVIYGVLRSVRVRVAGLVLLSTGLAMQTVAVASFEPDLRVAVYTVYAVAAASRAVLLFRLAER